MTLRERERSFVFVYRERATRELRKVDEREGARRGCEKEQRKVRQRKRAECEGEHL
jgi:hypothetical protein